MKSGIVLQILTVFYHYERATAIYGFGDEPDDPKRIRIFLEDDEKLLIPKNSNVEYVSPVIEFDQDIVLDKQPNFPPYASTVTKKQFYLPSQSIFNNQFPLRLYGKPDLTLEDLRIKSDFDPASAHLVGGYLGKSGFAYNNIHVLPQSAVLPGMQQHALSVGKVLRPIVLFPNGWIQGVNFGARNDIKPVTEDRPDDLKYDFRTKIHSLR